LTTSRKNATLLWEAFRLRPHVHLVVAGFSRRALRGCPPPPPNIFFLENPSDEDLARLYAHCKAVISASLYEGFDLPPVEGAFYGAPVLLSDIAIHREIWGEEAQYFDPWDPGALARLLDAPLTPSFQVARCFAPDKIKSQLLALLSDTLNHF
ncbi:MAG: glycosyltransferase, partial [Flavobacteriales bacterium]|nr:glycosyltransferase [Flavobacteriales bacterium]MDW8411031.1 glycosyltransferase [Flavobacteriales bacterium]